mmetsp:Transcript_3466/g.7212  ORF Transcript_3466/g.7212 Transcript_3466/m.7212 type:complete len:232 (+) Transcript_3466:54-749(+)
MSRDPPTPGASTVLARSSSNCFAWSHKTRRYHPAVYSHLPQLHASASLLASYKSPRQRLGPTCPRPVLPAPPGRPACVRSLLRLRGFTRRSRRADQLSRNSITQLLLPPQLSCARDPFVLTLRARSRLAPPAPERQLLCTVAPSRGSVVFPHGPRLARSDPDDCCRRSDPGEGVGLVAGGGAPARGGGGPLSVDGLHPIGRGGLPVGAVVHRLRGEGVDELRDHHQVPPDD